MNSTDREILRIEIMRLIGVVSPLAMGLQMLMVHFRVSFPQLESSAVLAELCYLTDKGLLAEDEKIVSPENKRWRVTATGRDWLAKQGLEN